MDLRSNMVEPILKAAYGKDWEVWRGRWRMFFMACAELFGFHDGSEWFVSHYLFRQRG
jgi:cyclopropane-fatty-acyl-phospholipid synthase